MKAIFGVLRFGAESWRREDFAAVEAGVARYGRGPTRVCLSGAIAIGIQSDTAEGERDQVEQPFAMEDLVIVADTRIDGRPELYDALSLNEEEDAALSDDELILRSYRKWGEACPRHIVGDYAFAIWDAAREHLFCARDHVGARPFYDFHRNGLFAFASDIRAVLALPEVDAELDEDEVARMLLSRTPGYQDATHTFLCGLHLWALAAPRRVGYHRRTLLASRGHPSNNAQPRGGLRGAAARFAGAGDL